MLARKRHILKDLIYELSHNPNKISKDGIIKRYNAMDIYHTESYINIDYVTHIKVLLERYGWTEP